MRMRLSSLAVIVVLWWFRCIGIGLAERDAPASQVIWCELHGDGVAGNEPDKMLLHLAAHVCLDDHMRELLRKFYLKDSTGKRLENLAFHLNLIVFCHELYKLLENSWQEYMKKKMNCKFFL